MLFTSVIQFKAGTTNSAECWDQWNQPMILQYLVLSLTTLAKERTTIKNQMLTCDVLHRLENSLRNIESLRHATTCKDALTVVTFYILAGAVPTSPLMVFFFSTLPPRKDLNLKDRKGRSNSFSMPPCLDCPLRFITWWYRSNRNWHVCKGDGYIRISPFDL